MLGESIDLGIDTMARDNAPARKEDWHARLNRDVNNWIDGLLAW